MGSRVLTVILNYKTPEMTLDSARAAVRAMAGMDGEIVIVDNASGDGSAKMIAAGIEAPDWPQGVPVRLVESPVNGGFGAGNNVGILAGLNGPRPDYVYILNSDAFPAENAIHLLRDHLETHPEAGFAGSYIHGPDGDPHITAFRFPTIWSELEGAARFGPITKLLRKHQVWRPIPETNCTVDWLAGASMMMRMSALEKIGLFDEAFFLYFEETELCHRLARAGYETHYVRDSHVAHIGSVSTGMKRWDRIPTYWLDSRWYYYCRTRGRGYAVLATLAHAAGGALWRVRRVLQRKPRLDPRLFLRDMLMHDAAALFRPLPASRVTYARAAKS